MPLSSALGTAGLQNGVCTSETRPTTPYTGQLIYETDTGLLRVWNGSAWGSPKLDNPLTVRSGSTDRVVPFAMAAGSSGFVNASTATVTFPAGRFTATPMVTTGLFWVGATYNLYMQVSMYDLSSTGFTWYATDTRNGNSWNLSYLSIHWHAIQMTSSSGAG